MTDDDELRVAGNGERWRIEGGWRAADRQLCNDYLGYLADRRYSPASVRAYAFDLLHFARWLAREDIGLDRAETADLLSSFRTDRDRAIAGLMLLSGLRSAEVLGLRVADVDIGRGWVRVTGKGDKERRVPLDPDVAGLIQAYLLAERPETASRALFVVAKGPHRGQPLTAAGLRRVFRYHREISGVAAGHPHALRHSFGTALAEAGVDLPVLQALMGHDHVDSSAAYIHLAPAHVRAAYDAARERKRAWQAGR